MAHYLFVDGGYLDSQLRYFSDRYFKGESIELDASRISQLYGHKRFDRTFYYHCPPARRKDESDKDFEARTREKDVFFDRLRLVPGVHCFIGSMYGAGDDSRQKQIDVKLATDMLTFSYRGVMQRATLLSGDEDFKPVVDDLVKHGTWVNVCCGPSSYSNQLVRSADERTPFTLQSALQLTTKVFRDRHPNPPQSSGHPGGEFSNEEQITILTSARGELYPVYNARSLFWIEYVDPWHPERKAWVVGPDFVMVRRLLEDILETSLRELPAN